MRWLILLLSALPVFADGGAVQSQQTDGPFLVTVFAAPAGGSIDASVLVQDRTTLNPVLDAQVAFQIGERIIHATHGQAQNKLLYAASLGPDLWGRLVTSSGRRPYSVSVSRAGSQATITGILQVAPPTAELEAYWSYLALPPCAIALFAANQWLRRYKMKHVHAKS